MAARSATPRWTMFDVKQAVENTRKLLQEQQCSCDLQQHRHQPTAAILPLAAETKNRGFLTRDQGRPRDNFNRYLFHVRASYADEAPTSRTSCSRWAYSAWPCSTRTMPLAKPCRPK